MDGLEHWPFHSQAQQVNSPNPLKEKRISEVVRIGSIIIFHLSKAMKSQVLHTVWCHISCEAAGEFWHWSLSGVKGLTKRNKERMTIIRRKEWMNEKKYGRVFGERTSYCTDEIVGVFFGGRWSVGHWVRHKERFPVVFVTYRWPSRNRGVGLIQIDSLECSQILAVWILDSLLLSYIVYWFKMPNAFNSSTTRTSPWSDEYEASRNAVRPSRNGKQAGWTNALSRTRRAQTGPPNGSPFPGPGRYGPSASWTNDDANAAASGTRTGAPNGPRPLLPELVSIGMQFGPAGFMHRFILLKKYYHLQASVNR